jgi:GT2 family glycosyltransferase
MSIKLTASIVIHFSNQQLLEDSVLFLKSAVNEAIKKNTIKEFILYIVDNSDDKNYSTEIEKLIVKIWNNDYLLKFIILDKNKGYGNAHNVVMDTIDSDFHIIMNPDVLIDINAISEAIKYMQNNSDVGLISPNAVNEDGNKLYLLKRYPPILTLFIRGFFPKTNRSWFKKRSQYYEMRDIDQDKEYKGVSIASGCFMLFRTKDILNKFKFSEKFFLYFEDFDFSWQFSYYTKIAYVPTVKIVHYGGDAAKKGIKHISLFIRSAITFYNRYGWKVI